MSDHLRNHPRAATGGLNSVRFLSLLVILGLYVLWPAPRAVAQSTTPQIESIVEWGSQNVYLPVSDHDDFKAIAAGSNHNLALKPDGTVVAWGYNFGGTCIVPEGLGGVVAIAAGGFHSLALKNDGTVVAWGNNGFGQNTMPAALNGVVAIADGYNHSLALKGDGSVVAWGWNGYDLGQVPLAARGGVVAIAAGRDHSLALKSDGSVVAWGSNNDNQCSVPAGLSNVVAIAAGDWHSLALKSDGTVVTWGRNYEGQCNVPLELSGVVAISAGDWHSLALKSDGTVVAWGRNSSSQSTVPAGLNGVVAISAGGEHCLALKGDGTVVAWGNKSSGQSFVPAELNGVVAIAAGHAHDLALKHNGTVLAWGYNEFGQCTVPIAAKSDVTAIAAGYGHSLALKDDGTVVAWGYNDDGQCNVPAGLSGVVAIAAGSYHSLALKSDGTVVAWGNNFYRQCIVPGGLRDVVAIAAGGWHSLALRSDVLVLGWGNNTYGQAAALTGQNGLVTIAAGREHSLALKSDGTVVTWGNNNFSQCNVPARQSGVVSIAAGDLHSLALKGDGTVLAWGYNGSGQCNVPAGLGMAVVIAAGGNHSLALWTRGNRAPLAADDTAEANEDTPVMIDLLANDSDPDRDPLTVTEITQGAHGKVEKASDGKAGTYIYTPNANFSGTDSFAYGISDGRGGTATGGVTITVKPVNDAPAAQSDAYSAIRNRVLIIPVPGVLANDADADGDPLTAALVSGPAHGTLTLNPGGSFTYTPSLDYNGSDFFTYCANDGTANSNPATVTLTVKDFNEVPAAVNDAYTVIRDTALTIAAPGVLANDTDANGDPLIAVLVSGPAHGFLTLNPNGSFSYIPVAGYVGSDAFTYCANDGTANSTGTTVALTITEPPPIFGLDSGNGVWQESAGYLEVMRFRNVAGSGLLTQLEILFDSSMIPSGKVRLGIYADNNGTPGNCLLDAGEATVTTGWVAIRGLNLPVTQNTDYWLAFILQNANVVRYQGGQPVGAYFWTRYNYGALPVQYPAVRATTNAQCVMRATVVPGVFGLNSGNIASKEPAGYLEAMRFQNHVGSGLLTQLAILCDSASTLSGKVRLGVYADSGGQPGSLLLDAGEVTVTSGWTTISGLSLPVSPNTSYWLAFNLQNANLVRYQTGLPSSGAYYWTRYNYGAFPAQYLSLKGTTNEQCVMQATIKAGLP